MRHVWCLTPSHAGPHTPDTRQRHSRHRTPVPGRHPAGHQPSCRVARPASAPRGDRYPAETRDTPRSAERPRCADRARRETQTARSARPPRTQDRQHNQYNFSSRSTENAQSLICSLTCRISLHISLTASPTTPHVVRGARPRTRRTHSLDRSHRPLLARRGGLGAPPQAPGSVAYHILVRWPARG